MSSDSRVIVSNEMEILLRQIQSLSGILSSQTKDMGGFGAEIKSLNKTSDEIKKNIDDLFSSRNEINQNCNNISGEITRDVYNNKVDTKQLREDTAQKIKEIRNDIGIPAAFEERVSSLEGFINIYLEEKKNREVEERIASKDKRSKLFTISWDIVKLAIQVVIAIGVAYLTVRWTKP